MACFTVQLENGRTWRSCLYAVDQAERVARLLRHLAPGAIIQYATEEFNIFNTAGGVIDDFGRWRMEDGNAQGPLGQD
jgi:hypothetical protein